LASTGGRLEPFDLKWRSRGGGGPAPGGRPPPPDRPPLPPWARPRGGWVVPGGLVRGGAGPPRVSPLRGGVCETAERGAGVRVEPQHGLELALGGTDLAEGEMQICGEQMAHAVVGREAQSLRDEIRGFLEATFLAIQVSAPEERGGIGRAREAGDGVPDAREGPQKGHVV